MEKLLIANPEIYKYQKKFIRWNNFNDNIIFLKLLMENLYIDGFVNDEFAHLSLYNKPIYSRETISLSQNVCIINDIDGNGSPIGPSAFVLNPCLDNRKVMIFGCGENGRMALDYLEKYFVKPDGFIDSDLGKVGKEFRGYQIYAPEIIADLAQDAVIVLAADQYQTMAETVRQYSPCIKMLHFDGYLIRKCGDTINGVAMNIALSQVMRGKAIYLYGSGNKVKEYADFFRLLDISPQGIFLDFENSLEDEIADMEAKPVEEILYEDNFCVVICSDEETREIQKLENLGLRASEHFVLSSSLRPDKYELRKSALDVNLGYTYISRTGDYGVSRLIAKRKEKYKIAILGGSTTDGELYTFKSWPEVLGDRIDQNYISIYNYGVAGYGIGQEMIRLIRDIIAQRPNLILAYNGYNDSCEYSYGGIKNLLNFKYLSGVVQFAGRHLEERHQNERRIYGGEDVYPDNFSRWLSGVEFMHGMAELYHIPFVNFLQPMLHDKRQKTKEEELMCKFDIPRKAVDRGFREPFAALVDKPDYIVDLSDIFDNVHDVFIDICHVNKKGNEIIAEHIYQSIKLILQDWDMPDDETGR